MLAKELAKAASVRFFGGILRMTEKIFIKR